MWPLPRRYIRHLLSAAAVWLLLTGALPAGAATVAVQVQTDREDVETRFNVELGGELVALLPGAIATDDDAAAEGYVLTLARAPGFDLTGIACTDQSDGSAPPGSANLDTWAIRLDPGPDAAVDCVFSLQVLKATVVATVNVESPEPVEQSFNLDLGSELVTLWPGDLVTDDDANSDFYVMTLAPVNGFQLLDIGCVGRADGRRLPASLNLALGAITLAPGAGNTVDCEFLLRPRTATVSATVATDSAVPVETEFTLEMNGDPVLLLPGELTTDTDARADLYRMALIPDRRFQLEDVACVRESDNERLSVTINSENQSVAFAPGIGNRVHCTLHLRALQAAVTARVMTNRPNAETIFEIEMNGEPYTLAQAELARDERSQPDLYRIALLRNPDYRLTDIACLRDGERLNATIDGANQSIAFAPGRGGNVDCTFSLQALKAQVTAAVQGVPQQTFILDMNGEEVEVIGSESATDNDANALLYRVALLRQPGLQVTDISCSRAGERLNAFIDMNNQSVGFSPGAGSSVHCAFTVTGGAEAAEPLDLLTQIGIDPDNTNGGLSTDADGRPRITLGGQGTDTGSGTNGGRNDGTDASATAAAADRSCCSCTDLGSSFVRASSRTGRSEMPCDFNVPADWDVSWGNDGLLVSVVSGPTCSGYCPSGRPSLSLSIAVSPDNNADVYEEIWRERLPVVGSGRCGEGGVVFYQSPGGMPGQPMGSVRFYVTFGGKRYGGTALFSCGGPPDWEGLQSLFINSFGSNPGANFP